MPNRGGRLAMLAAAVLSAGALATACSGIRPDGRSLVIYNGQHEQTTDALVAAFEHETGISVVVRNDDETAFANQIADEGSHSPADLVFTENSPALEFLQGRGLLAPVDRSTLARVPARFESPEGDWVGVSARVSVLVYNTRMLQPRQLPTSVLQLADPLFKGKVAMAAGETDFQPIVTAVARAYGHAKALAWLTALKDNAGNNAYPDNETLTEQVNSGGAAIGIIDQYYWYRLRAAIGPAAVHSAIAYFAPGDPGYVLDVSGAAVLASSPHRQEAERFLAFLVSQAGQEIIAHGDSFEYPLLAGVKPAAPETPFSSLKPDPISVSDLGDGSTALGLLQQAQLL